MEEIYVNKYEEKLEPKISKEVKFLTRVKNRLLRWWVPIGGVTLLAANIGISLATGNLVGVTSIVNKLIFTGWNFIIGGALLHGFARNFIFKNRTKLAKQENAIYKADKKNKKAFKKFSKQRDNYNDLFAQAESKYQILANAKSENDVSRKQQYREYKRIRRRLDKTQLKLAKYALKIEGSITGMRAGPVEKSSAVVGEPLRKLAGKSRGLIASIRKYNDAREKIGLKEKEVNTAFRRFKYNGNETEAKRRLKFSQLWLSHYASQVKSLDGKMHTAAGKKYKSGSNFLQRAYRKIRYFNTDPIVVMEKTSMRPANYSEDLHKVYCKAAKEKRFWKEYEQDLHKTNLEEEKKDEKGKGTDRFAEDTEKEKTNTDENVNKHKKPVQATEELTKKLSEIRSQASATKTEKQKKQKTTTKPKTATEAKTRKATIEEELMNDRDPNLFNIDQHLEGIEKSRSARRK